MSSVDNLVAHLSGAADAGRSGVAQAPHLVRSARGVVPALQAAADRTGIDFSYLFHTARLESSFRPDAKASTSSASGLFQFIETTWLSTLRKHGAAHGIRPGSTAEALNLRNDPSVASLMAAEHAVENAGSLEKGLGRKATASDLYLAHFLGSGGALRFLKGLAANPASAAAKLLPAAAKANQAIFFAKGVPRSLQAVHDLLARRFNGPAATVAPDQTGAAQRPEPARSVQTNPSAGALPDRATLERLMFDTRTSGTDGHAAQSGIDPKRAAQAAYLLLAELGV